MLGILGYIAALLVSLALLTEYLPTLKENSKKFWYIPAVLIAARTVVQVLYMLVNFAFFRAFTSLFWGVIEAGAFFLACAWCVCPDGIPNTFDAKTFGGAFNADEDVVETGRMERISTDADFVYEIIEMMKKLKIGGEKFYIFAAKYIVRHSDMYAWQ